MAWALDLPLLSLDSIKEALGDTLGVGDEAWSDRLGEAAAEILFRIAPTMPAVVVEGWWRRERRDRAVATFAGWTEVFCHCSPELARERATSRARADRHPVHRDAINPAITELAADLARATSPLNLGGPLLRVDTGAPVDIEGLAGWVRSVSGGAKDDLADHLAGLQHPMGGGGL